MCRRSPTVPRITTTLLLLAFLIGSLPASTPAAASAPAQDAAPAGGATTRLRAVAPGAVELPSAQPDLDARQLLAEWRAAGSPTDTPIFDEQAVSRLAAQSAAPDSFGEATPNGSPGVVVAAGALPAPAEAAEVAAPAAPDTAEADLAVDARVTRFVPDADQSGVPQNCTQVLADTGNSNPTRVPPIWPVYERIVYYADFEYTSAPYAWYLAENELSVNDGPTEDSDTVRDTRPGRNTDLDGFGQPFDVPQDLVSLSGSFNFQYVTGTTLSGDRLYIEFYAAGPTGGANGYGDYIVGTSVEVGALDDGQWRTFNWSLTDADTLGAMRGQRVVLRLSTYNNNNGISTKLFIDDITANLCKRAIVGGRVTRIGNGAANSGDLSNAVLLLTVNSAEASELLALTTPRSDGLYAFGGLPALPANLYYQVLYFNYSLDGSPLDDSRLSLLFGPFTSGAVGPSDIIALPTFDISNVILTAPKPYARVEAPAGRGVPFTWQNRGLPSGYPANKYQYCIYDAQTVYQGTQNPVILCTELLTNPQAVIGPDSFPDDYPFNYERRYAWYVLVGTDLNNNGIFEQVGYSFYEHAVIFAEQASTPPSDPRQPSGSLPAKDTRRPWTVMIYFAGDNDLGDRDRLPNPVSNLRDQFAALKSTAARATNAHVVALGDFYGNTGTEICYLSEPSGPQCKELGEQNTADPALLTSFINQGLAYPSDHTMLVIASHGHAVVGAGLDETAADAPTMAPDEIAGALAAAGLNNPTRKLDVIFFNACLMATVETATMMAPFADYMVASADQLWVLGFYDRIFNLLGGGPRSVAAGIADAYSAALDAVVPDVYRTLIALDLSQIGVVNAALNKLADALAANQSGLLAEIDTRRAAAQVYDSSGNNLLDAVYDNTGKPTPLEEDAFVDVAHLATLLAGSANGTVASAATGLAGALGNGLVVRSLARSGSNGEGSRHDYVDGAIGLGLYFPNGQKTGGQPTLNDLYLNGRNVKPFNDVSTWDNFLRSYVIGIIGRAPGTVGRAPGTVGRAGRPVGGQAPRAGGPSDTRLYLPLLRR